MRELWQQLLRQACFQLGSHRDVQKLLGVKVSPQQWDACRSAVSRRCSAGIEKQEGLARPAKTESAEVQAVMKQVLDKHSYITGKLRRNRKLGRDQHVRMLSNSKRRVSGNTQRFMPT